jgi:hypothetical protein
VRGVEDILEVITGTAVDAVGQNWVFFHFGRSDYITEAGFSSFVTVVIVLKPDTLDGIDTTRKEVPGEKDRPLAG